MGPRPSMRWSRSEWFADPQGNPDPHSAYLTRTTQEAPGGGVRGYRHGAAVSRRPVRDRCLGVTRRGIKYDARVISMLIDEGHLDPIERDDDGAIWAAINSFVRDAANGGGGWRVPR